jgi:hypothetical protein
MTPFSNNTSGSASQQPAELNNRSRPQACASHSCLRVNASMRSRGNVGAGPLLLPPASTSPTADVGATPPPSKRARRWRYPVRRNPTARRGSRRQEAIVAASAAPFRRQHHERGLRVPSNARTDVSSQMAMAERTSKGGRSRCSNPASPGRKHQRSANAGRGLRPRFAYARGSADLTSRCWCSVLRSGHLVAALEHYRFDATGELASRCERRK